MNYESCIPLRTRSASVWIVKFDDGNQQLLVTSTKLSVLAVINIVKASDSNKKFTISSVDVGLFNLDKTIPVEHSYTSDAREINQDMYVTIADEEER